MLKVDIDKQNKVVILAPQGALSEQDFILASEVIDPFIKELGPIDGIIIYTESFPGWDSFSGLIEHLKFVYNHHQKISYVAFVTDSIVGDFVENIANHFISAELKHFSFKELENAKKWISESKNKITKHGISIGINRVDDNFFMTFKVAGKLTHKDYECIRPMIDNALKGVNEPKIKMLVDITEFDGWEARAAWDDFKIGLHYGFDFDKIAIFGSHNKLIDYTVKISSWFLKDGIQEFESEKDAIDWLNV